MAIFGRRGVSLVIFSLACDSLTDNTIVEETTAKSKSKMNESLFIGC